MHLFCYKYSNTFEVMKRIIGIIFTVVLASCGRADNLNLLIGTFTNADSEGIYSYTLDQNSGSWEQRSVAPSSNPAFLAQSEDGKTVFAVNENGTAEDGVEMFSFNAEDGTLESLQQRKTATTGPCYVSTNGELVLTANYSGGSMDVFRLEDGELQPCAGSVPGSTGGPHPNQSSSHVHCATFTPDGCYVLATDFSADRILHFSVSGEELRQLGTVTPVSAGTGPRHITFSPDGTHAYVIGELSGEVTAFDYADGALTQIQVAAADSLGAQGSADIHLSPDGKFLYASNRLKGDGIAIFSVDPDSGRLFRAGYQPTAAHPRNFCITPNGKFLLCASRDEDRVQIYERDPQTGLLSDIHNDIPVSRPVCVMFVSQTR